MAQDPGKKLPRNLYETEQGTDVEIHYTKSTPALPVKPSEAESTSLYHESLKNIQQSHLHTNEHTARDYALSTLADSQSYDYIKHHLQDIAGMEVVKMEGIDFDDEILELLKVQAKHAKEQEEEAVKARAKIYLDRNDLLTEYEIRRRSTTGNLDGLSHLAHEKTEQSLSSRRLGWENERKMSRLSC